ncbi:MAG: AmmeMemoRadiSam system protein B [Treponema sp.]|jgi:AmmeMemoRadiSam system protein B|nr:AmmeMemoRadiSam system protein B [Treponema sp.]
MADVAFPKEKIRSPVVGGLFYPEEKKKLETRLRSFGLERGKGGNAAAIIAPHGAWDISGTIAGAAFSAAGGRESGENCRRALSGVVVLGTIHDPNEEGLFLSDSDFFETPLGNLPVDFELNQELASCSTLFEINDSPHLREHSIEVLLPFIRYFFPPVPIVPVLMGSARHSLISALARGLRIVLEPRMKELLLVISCNLSKNNNKTRSLLQAEECIRLLQEGESEKFISGIYSGRISACGGALAASVLESGLLSDKAVRLVSGPLLCAREEDGQIIYYGALSFE